MEDPAVEEIIKANVARARLHEMILSISKRIYSEFRTSRRVKMEEILSVLREYGPYINTADSYGETSMHVACRLDKCDMDILQELLKHGGLVDTLNGSGESSLHLVARNSEKIDMMRELLKYSRNTNIPNVNGETPLYVAIKQSRHNLVMVYELLEHGADFRIADNKGRNSLHAVVRNPCCNLDLMKKFLQEAPTFVNCQDTYGSTPLHGAVRYCNNLGIVKELLDRGADPNIKNKRDRTPLHIAVLKPHADIVEILLEHGADVNALDSSHQTPLHHSLSVDKPDISVIQTLMKYGANVNAVNQYDMNVLTVAVCNPTTPYEIIKLFLENGAKPDFDENSNILVNIDQPNRYHLSELLIPYIIIRLINSNTDNAMCNFNYYTFLGYILDQFQTILLFNTTEHSHNFKHFLKIGGTCIMELLKMRNDFICNDQTLFQFVSENCSRTTPHNQNVALGAIDEVLLRLRDGKYVQCKDLIYTSVKRSVLVNRLCELGVRYKVPGNDTLTLNSLCINNLAKYLSKEDVLNMIVAFCDKFGDLECPSTSKRSTEGVEKNVCKKARE